jgi:hypothetical protein
MKTIWKTGRWLILSVVLLSLTGFIPPDRPAPPEDAGVAILLRLARRDLQARLGIRAGAIVVASTRPFTFSCAGSDTCLGRQPGYVIRFAVGNLTYEYNARMLGNLGVLWHEV